MEKAWLEEISDKIRSGEPVGIFEAMAAVDYQEKLKSLKKKSLWYKTKKWWHELKLKIYETICTNN